MVIIKKVQFVVLLVILISVSLSNSLIADDKNIENKIDVKTEVDKVYIGDAYETVITVLWSGVPAESSPAYIEYNPAEGREVLSIERRDALTYDKDNRNPHGITTFRVKIKVSENTDDLATRFKQLAGIIK